MDELQMPKRLGVIERLEFIEFRLFWEGRINRADLIKRFRLSVPQASTDLGRYLDVAKENMRYDPRQRVYLATEQFMPILYRPTARQYLADLRGIADNAVIRERTWLGELPDHDIVPSPRKPLEARRLRTIIQAIQNKQAIAVEYQSMSNNAPTQRWLTPHALGFDGARWHMRAWCSRRQEFRDFVLARVLDIAGHRYHPIDQQHDLEWMRPITFRIGPRSELQAGRRRAVEHEYDMLEGELHIKVRMSMSYYLEKNLLLDVDVGHLSPERAPLLLLNRAEVDAIREATRDEQEPLNDALATTESIEEG